MAKSVIDLKKVPYVRTVTEFDKGGRYGELKFESKHGVKVYMIDQFSKSNQRHAEVQGFKSKFIDEFAGHAQDWSFVCNALDNMDERMQSENWNVGRSDSFGGTADLFQAIVNTNKTKVTFEQVEVAWDALDDEGKREWRGNAVFQAEKLDIQTKRAKAKAADADPINIKIG